jgi:hypothetical protein
VANVVRNRDWEPVSSDEKAKTSTLESASFCRCRLSERLVLNSITQERKSRCAKDHSSACESRVDESRPRSSERRLESIEDRIKSSEYFQM